MTSSCVLCRKRTRVRGGIRPFYGVEGKGWFLSYHVFTRYVKVTFFQGALLQRIPPGAGKDKNSRWTDIYGVGLDEERVIKWVRQAAAMPGWRGFDKL